MSDIYNNYTYNTDHAAAAAVYSSMYKDLQKFDLQQELVMPSIQAIAMAGLIATERGEKKDLQAKQIAYIDDALKNHMACLDKLKDEIKNAFPDIARPAMYQPVSPGGEQWETISENMTMMPALSCHAASISGFHREHDLARMIALNPSYYQVSEITWTSIGELIKGNVPMGLMMEGLTNSSEGSVLSGRLGRAHGQFRRNLGLIEYRVQKAGRSEQREERASLNRDVNPIARQMDIREMLITPTQRVAFGIEQAQFLQNALQNAFNACAQKPPYEFELLQLELKKCETELSLAASKAGLMVNNVPSYAAIFNSQIRDLASGLSRYSGGGNMFSFRGNGGLGNPSFGGDSKSGLTQY